MNSIMTKCIVTDPKDEYWFMNQWHTGQILGLHPANERSLYKVTPSHWLGANLESTSGIWCMAYNDAMIQFMCICNLEAIL